MVGTEPQTTLPELAGRFMSVEFSVGATSYKSHRLHVCTHWLHSLLFSKKCLLAYGRVRLRDSLPMLRGVLCTFDVVFSLSRHQQQ